LQPDLRLLILSALIGFISASFLELIKYGIERRRQRVLERQTKLSRRSAELAEFLRGAEINTGIPEPAWLRLIGSEQRRFTLRLPRLAPLSTMETKPVKTVLKPKRTRRKRGRKGRKLLLGPLTVIGRSPLCDLCLPDDPAVSSEHALIRYENDGYYLYDLGSINGTYLDGARLEAHTRAALQGGETISLGKTYFEFGTLRKTEPLAQSYGNRPSSEETEPCNGSEC
jgi:hypothetical protein